MNKKIFLVFAVLIFVMPKLILAEISYSGSSTIGEHIMPEAAEVFKKNTGIKFSLIDNPGSGKGIQALLDNKVLIAGVSRSLTASEKASKLSYQIIGYDAITIFVHKNNPIKNISKAQLKAIFTGQIKNWKEVGGNDAPILCITETWGEKRATMIEFQTLVMDGAEYGKNRKEVDKPRDQVNALLSVENGIAYASGAFALSGIKFISVDNIPPDAKNVRSGAYLISRPLLLVTKGLAKGDAKKFMDFILSSEGQRIVAKKFVTVK